MDKEYIAANHRAWWNVGLRDATPILATYMARRPPALMRSNIDARYINVAHGACPRTPTSSALPSCLADTLCANINLSRDRTYADRPVKFEPREIECIPAPSPDRLAERTEP